MLHPAHAAICWPRPAARGAAPPLTATDTGGAQSGAIGDEDFAGLRPFQAGDSLRRVAWKAYARGQGLHTKQYAGTDVVSHVFDWDSLPDSTPRHDSRSSAAGCSMRTSAAKRSACACRASRSTRTSARRTASAA